MPKLVEQPGPEQFAMISVQPHGSSHQHVPGGNAPIADVHGGGLELSGGDAPQCDTRIVRNPSWAFFHARSQCIYFDQVGLWWGGPLLHRHMYLISRR